MTTATPNLREEQAADTLEIPSTRSLEEQLSILNEAQLEALFAYYGKDGLAKYDSLTDTNATPDQVQSALAEFINNDSNESQKKKLLSQLEGYNLNYRQKEQTFLNTEEKATAILKRKREDKKELNKSVSSFTKALESNLVDSNKQLLQQRRIEQKNYQAWEKREKIRQKGIDAYLRGIVAAVIDDCEEEYKKDAREKAAKVSKTAKAQVKALKDKFNIDPKSMEGTEKIFKNSFPKRDMSSEMKTAYMGAPSQIATSKGFGNKIN